MPGFLSSKPKVSYARTLRQEGSDAERRLWYLLRDRSLTGFKFRRQFPVGPYITDFCCYDRRLIVELDGGQHAKRRSYDDVRTEYLNKKGFNVIRFWNNDVLKHTGMILRAIRMELDRTMREKSDD